VAIAHAFGLAGRFDFDRSAETFTFVSRHWLDLIDLQAAQHIWGVSLRSLQGVRPKAKGGLGK
jgi:hypothetical protein